MLPFPASILFKKNYNATAHIVVNQGGSSSGKTYAIMQALFCLACQAERQVITIVGQDMPNLKAGVIRDAHNIYYGSPHLMMMIKTYNRTDSIFEFHNGTGRCFTTRGQSNKNPFTLKKYYEFKINIIKNMGRSREPV